MVPPLPTSLKLDASTPHRIPFSSGQNSKECRSCCCSISSPSWLVLESYVCFSETQLKLHRSSVDGFFLPVPPTDFAQPLLHNKEELLGLRTTGASCWQWGVSSGFLSPQRSLETMMWQWHINKLLYWFMSELDWISELLLTFICLAKSWALNFVFQVHWVNTPSLRTRINHCGWSQVWTGTSVMVTLKTSPITHGCFVGPFNMFGKSVKQATPFSKCWLSLTWTPREPFVRSRRADAWSV